MPTRMSTAHLLLVVGLMVVWGVNFVMISVGLAHLPPLLLSALRFVVAAIPAVFVLRSPRVPWRYVFLVAAFLGVLKFGLLFSGMAMGMPPGLSSLVLQAQAVFTAVFALAFLGERPRPVQFAGLLVALGGIALIGIDLGRGSTVTGFLLILAAAAMWGVTNVVMRRAQPPDNLSFMVWVSAVAAGPLLVLSLVFEGVDTDLAALRDITWPAVGSVLYVGLLATVFGFGVWGFLIRTYSASTVAPFSMLAPVFAMASSALVTHEQLSGVKITAAVLVVSGVLLPTLWRVDTSRTRHGTSRTRVDTSRT